MLGWFRVFRSQKLQIGLYGSDLAVFETGGQQIENAGNKGNKGNEYADSFHDVEIQSTNLTFTAVLLQFG